AGGCGDGDGGELAALGLLALGLEQVVRDPQLDGVGFPREEKQRLVLRLPAEPRNRPVVAVAVRPPRDRPPRHEEVGMATDAELLLGGGVGGLVGEARAVRTLLDEASPTDGRRDSAGKV